MKILFLCVANSARSQLAEGLAKSIFGEAVEFHSAGSQPSGQVHLLAIKVMSEIGIDISSNKSKSIEDFHKDFIENLDYVITLCAEEICPLVVSKAQRLHWPFPDPAAVNPDKKLWAFRQIRDEIRKEIEKFKSTLSL